MKADVLHLLPEVKSLVPKIGTLSKENCSLFIIVYFWFILALLVDVLTVGCCCCCLLLCVVLCCVVMLCVTYFWSSRPVLDHPALLVIVSTLRLFHLIKNLHLCNIMYNSEQWRIRIAPNSPFRHITYLLSVRTGRTEHVHDSYFSNKKIKK